MINPTAQDILIYLRQQMIAEHITIKELAQRLQRTQATVSMTFRQTNITLSNLTEICDALGYNLEINLIPKGSMEKTG